MTQDGAVFVPPVQEILKDYCVGYLSRLMSLTGRKEVLNGKAKFGIFGDGKEVPQLALARCVKPGDWRAGYYRDQTLMLALGLLTPKEFFAQLYAHPSSEAEPASGGRQMNSHFATRFIEPDGSWKNQTEQFHSSSDISPTAGQMARLLGLGYASKLYRESSVLKKWSGAEKFSHLGNEIAFGTIGNASTSEGIFWETLNAVGVLQVPVVISVWDDDYGISVPNQFQTTKESISRITSGFSPEGTLKGVSVHSVKGHDYLALLKLYQSAVAHCRQDHAPYLIHVTHLTQPQGHSTSGSHERYKNKDRLAYESEWDCLTQMRQWILKSGVVDEKTLKTLEEQKHEEVEEARAGAWKEFQAPMEQKRSQVLELLEPLVANGDQGWSELSGKLRNKPSLLRRDLHETLEETLRALIHKNPEEQEPFVNALNEMKREHQELFSSYLHCHQDSPLQVAPVPAQFSHDEKIDGRLVIQRYFGQLLTRDPRVFIIGEDIGQLGGVNLEFENLMEQHGTLRVGDTGIREATILGQGIGCAIRGLRPIVDIQYLDYLLYCLQTMSDDLATLHYRSAGGQLSPVIIRTKGHRLEGIWHTGSPMGMIINACRGIHVCVPRNCVQAVGMYQTLLQGNDPGLVIEVLNGYRLKELCPDNLEHFAVPLGVPEILHAGTDITVVTYGANVRLMQSSIPSLEALNISVELIDVQTLLPFDRYHLIKHSVMKTHALLCLDEDVPGGASAYMMQQICEEQGAYDFLDCAPRTISAQPHRSAYASDGDYFSKPNQDEIIRRIYHMMHERYPKRFLI